MHMMSPRLIGLRDQAETMETTPVAKLNITSSLWEQSDKRKSANSEAVSETCGGVKCYLVRQLELKKERGQSTEG